MRAPVTIRQLGAIKAQTDTEAVAAVEALLWPKGPVCTKCNAVNQANRISRYNSAWASVFRCKVCRASFSTKMGTVFQGKTNNSWLQITRMCAAYNPDVSPGILAVAAGYGMGVQRARTFSYLLRRAHDAGTIWDVAALKLLAQKDYAAREPNKPDYNRRYRALLREGKREPAPSETAEYKRAAKAEQRERIRNGERPQVPSRTPEARAARRRAREIAQEEPHRPYTPRTPMYWDKPMAEDDDKKAAQEKRFEEAEAKRAADPDAYSPAEAERRFNALLKAALHTRPVNLKAMSKEERKAHLASLPTTKQIANMPVEKMEAIANAKAARDLGAPIITGPDGGRLSDLMQEAIVSLGGEVDEKGHGSFPVRLSPAEREAARAERARAISAAPGPAKTYSKLSEEERRAIDLFDKSKIKVAPTRNRRQPLKHEKKPAPKRNPEGHSKAEEAVAFCVEVGLSIPEACERTGAHPRMVQEKLKEMRDAGQPLGLYTEQAAARARSASQKKRWKKIKENE